MSSQFFFNSKKYVAYIRRCPKRAAVQERVPHHRSYSDNIFYILSKKSLRLISLLLIALIHHTVQAREVNVEATTQDPLLIITGVNKHVRSNISNRLKELLHDPEKIAPSELQQQIRAAMQPFGFFKPQIALTQHPLKITVHPGPPLKINHIAFILSGEGKNNKTIKRATNDFTQMEGNTFNSNQYEKAKQHVINSAEREGYLRASFEKAQVRIDLMHYRSDMVLRFNTGPLYFFGQVQFDPTYISPALLARYLPFQPGQPFSDERLLILNDDLSASGYFSSVAIKPLMNKSETVPITIHLTPASRISTSLGLGYGTDTGIRGRAGLNIIPLNRAGHKLNAVVLGSLKESALQAAYIIPGLNPTTNQYTITTNLSNLNYNTGYANAVLVSLAQQNNLPTFQRTFSFNGLYERFRYTHQPGEENVTAFPKATLSWRSSDALFTPSGYSLTINALAANKLFASQINFEQASLNGKAAFTFIPFRMRFYWHTIQGVTQIRDINALPLSLALLLGGSENLKAYTYNSLGPGKILTYQGLEIQKETKNNLYLLGFFDAGNVYQSRANQLKTDFGLGLMWVSRAGPIKVGLAQALNDHFFHALPRKSLRLIISMGPDL